jgi:hypothetical protein
MPTSGKTGMETFRTMRRIMLMKIAKLLAVAVVTFGSIPLVAQQVKTEAQQDA